MKERGMDLEQLNQEIDRYKTAFNKASRTAKNAADHGDFTCFQIDKDFYLGTFALKELFEDVFRSDSLVRLDLLESQSCCEGDEERKFTSIEDYYNQNEFDFPDSNQETEVFFTKPDNLWMLYSILSSSNKNLIYRYKQNDPLWVLVQQLFPIYQNQDLSPKEKFNEVQKVKNRFCTVDNQQKTIVGKKIEEKSVNPNRNPENDFFQKADSWNQVGFIASSEGITIKIVGIERLFNLQEFEKIIPKTQSREFLYELFRIGGVFEENNFKDPYKDNLKSYASHLRTSLKELFGISDNPIKSTGQSGYQTMFSIASKPLESGDH
jgi:hypothetical protein